MDMYLVGDNEHLKKYWMEHSLPVLIILHNDETHISDRQAIKTENIILKQEKDGKS